MRYILRTALIIGILIILFASARAVDVGIDSYSIVDKGSVERAVPRGARDLMGNTSIGEGLDFRDAAVTLFKNAALNVNRYITDALICGVKVFAIGALCGFAAGMSEKPQQSVLIAGAFAMTAAVAGDMASLIGLGKTTVTEMAAFSKVLLPVLAAAGAAAGGVISSNLTYVAVMFIVEAVISFMSGVMSPFITCYVAVITAHAATGNDGLAKLASFLKATVSTIIKIVLSLFVAYLGISGVISGATDALTQKTVKLGISGAIPVAGSIMADAAEAVIAGAKLVRGSVGVFGMISILAICLLPFLRLAAQYVIFRVTSVFSGVACVKELGNLIDGLGSAFSLILGITGACALLLLIGIFTAASGV